MAILSGAIVKIVARHTTLRTSQRGHCLHIAVSNGASLFNYFNTPGNPTSHFYVRKTGGAPAVKVGTPLSLVMADFEQYVDTKYRAPAQLDGNPTLISLETQGGVGSDLHAPWTLAACERIAWILAECHRIHGTPLKLMPNSKPISTGVGYHKLGIDPWRVSGGEKWSSSYGKECPVDQRISQIPSIIARALQIVNGTPVTPPKPPPTEEDAMAALTQAQVAQAVSDGTRDYMSDFYAATGTGTAVWNTQKAILSETQKQTTQLERIADALEKLVAVATAPKA